MLVVAVVSIFANKPPETGLSPAVLTAATIVFALVAIVVIARGRNRLRQTTLTHALWWCIGSLAVLAVLEAASLWLHWQSEAGDWSRALRLISASGMFCPAMAVLGARRPHHVAWQFIVASMWVMLSLPALEAVFLGRLETMDVGPVRGWFLWLMVAVSFVIYALTRFTFVAILTALGQVVLLSPFLPGMGGWGPFEWHPPAAAGLFMVAAIITASGYPRVRISDNEFDQRWFDFRDQFGAMWGLRVIERINAAARMYQWPFSLTWTGFYFHEAKTDWSSVSPGVKAELRQTLDNLLRRFV